MLLSQQLCLGFAKAHGFARARLHLAHEEDPHGRKQNQRGPAQQRIAPETITLWWANIYFDTLFTQLLQIRAIERNSAFVGGARSVFARNVITTGREGLDRAGVHLVPEFRIGDLLGGGLHHLTLEQTEESDQQNTDDDPNGEIAEIVHVSPQFLGG